MSSNLVKKTVCLLIIMALVLTTLSVIPLGLARSRNPIVTHSIDGQVVVDPTFSRVLGATVILYNLHTGARINTTTDTNGFFLFDNVVPGHYQLIAKPPKSDFISIDTSTSDIIVVDDEDVGNKLLFLKKVTPGPIYQVNGTIYNEYNEIVENATVTLKSLDNPGYSIVSKKTDENGTYLVKAYRGLYELWVTAPDFSYYIEVLNLNIPFMIDHDIILNFSKISTISGNVTFEKSPGDTQWDIFLYDLDRDEIIHETNKGYVFNIFAYHGRFGLIIDVPGYKPYYHPDIIELTSAQNSFKVPQGTINLKKTNAEKIVTKVSFNSNNWNSLHFQTTWTLNHDSELFGLKYVDYGDPITIGCPRFQVDMQPGFGGTAEGPVGGMVEGGEVDNLTAWLTDRGPFHMYTEDVFEINNTHFGWKPNTFKVDVVDGFEGYYNATGAMVIKTNIDYQHLPTSEPLDSKAYKINFDKLRENEVIALKLPTGFEISNVQSYDTEKVWVKKFNECQINATTTIFVKSVHAPTAVIMVRDDSKDELDSPYVDTLVNLTFNASTSKPGSGVINRYEWKFGNNEGESGKAVVYNYTTPGIYNVTLDIFTTAGQTDDAWVHVTIDDTAPKGVIELQNETGVKITEGEENKDTDEYVITFNATKSTDTIDGSTPGKISRYYWQFEGASPNTGVGAVSNHSFDHPGTYHYNLTLTDAAGHTTVLERDINIKDIEEPEPKWKSDPPYTTRVCYIDKWIVLNGSISTDNSMPEATFMDKIKNLTFFWDMDLYKDSNNDGIDNNDADGTGWFYNFTPVRPGPHLFALWVKDPSNNLGNSTQLPPQEWQIDVIGPNLRLAPVHEEINKYIDVSDKKPTDGDEVKFTVNVTNENDITAWDIKVRLLVNGKQESVKTIKSLDQNDFKELTFKWKVDGAKKHNITFNVTLDNETYEAFWDNNEQTIMIDAQPKTPIDRTCVVAIIIIIIIVIAVAFYFFRRRRQEAELLGKRREKGKGKKKGKGKGKEKEKGKKKKSKVEEDSD